MGYIRSRTGLALGPPEFVLALLGCAVLGAGWWWLTVSERPHWELTQGRVVIGTVEKRGPAGGMRPGPVRVTYRYEVLGTPYTGHWEGLWPQGYSPNALSHDRIHDLEREGYPLVVAYNPANPRMSDLHRVRAPGSVFTPWLFLAAAGAAAVYLLWFYPRLRARRAR